MFSVSAGAGTGDEVGGGGDELEGGGRLEVGELLGS
jgi:hypothetical protein